MSKHSNPYLPTIAVLVGAGIGIGVGCLLFNEDLRHRLGRKMRRIGRACRYQSEEIRETASELLEKGGHSLKGARETGRRLYERVAG